MKPYDHKKIEKKWQKTWDDTQVYKTLSAKDATKKKLKPYYVLDMFPYPSGAGLHVGHPRGYIASDIFARMKRMSGFNVLHPMGFDSFGLPTEQYAIQTGKNPATVSDQLVKRYGEQLSVLGFSYDWNRQVATHDPDYYQWTQWIFLQIYNSWYDKSKNKARTIDELVKIFETSGNAKINAVSSNDVAQFSAKEWKALSIIEQQHILMKYRLAYEGYAEVNWCPEMGTVLANDEVIEKDGKMVSERGEFPVEKKSMRQWFMRITAYADRLIDGLETIDWSSSIKEIQKNWIGKSEGSEIEFKIVSEKPKYLIFDFDGVLGDTWEQMVEINISTSGLSRDQEIRNMKEYFSRKPVHARGAEKKVIKAQTDWNIQFDQKMKNAKFDLFEEFIEEIAKINNAKIAIVSSGTNGYIKPTIKRMNELGIHPTHVLTYEDHHSKEEKIEHICKDWDIDVLDAYYFTDTKADVYELESICDKSKLIGCGWGFLGADALCEVLPRNQVLVNHTDVHAIFESQLNYIMKVFTTRADTLFGVTYVVLAPEHSLVQGMHSDIKNWKEVEKYIASVKLKSDEDRVAAKEKTGIKLEGVFAINPANNEQVPVWISDYVLAGYGTGAVMAVPAHDERDFEFANNYNLPIKQVTSPENSYKSIAVASTLKDAKVFKGQLKEQNIQFELAVSTISGREHIRVTFNENKLQEFIKLVQDQITGTNWVEILGSKTIVIQKDSVQDGLLDNADDWFKKFSGWEPFVRGQKSLWDMLGKNPFLKEFVCYIDDGILKNSGEFNGLTSEEARKAITEFVGGKLVTKYKMRDAIFARQRYWGEPIPLIHTSLDKKYPKAIRVPFYSAFPFDLIRDGKKNVEVRALDKPGRDKVKVGDILRIEHLTTERVLFAKVVESYKFKNIRDLYEKGNQLVNGIRPEKETKSYEDFYAHYKAVEKDYEKRCDTYGMAVWKIELLNGDVIETVPEKQLPLKLPVVKSYAPSGNGEGPLATVKSWVNAGYETNTMPGWAGSSWYFLRYIDPKNKNAFANESELDYWFGKNGGVNMYVGGSEHATGHLLYSRFWHKLLKDLGYVKAEEPFQTLRNQGLIMGPDGRKMSKRWGNVINPDDVVRDMGADTMRVYEAFMGPFESSQPWSIDGIVGSRRFIERVWNIQSKVNDIKTTVELEKVLHKTIKKVTDDIANFSFNTAVSSMMICINEIDKAGHINIDDFKKFLQILAPFAPHMTDELWESLGERKSIHISTWPTYNAKKIIDDTITMGIQVNGKVRAEITLALDETPESVNTKVLAMPEIIKWIDGKEIKKFIYIPGKVISIVI